MLNIISTYLFNDYVTCVFLYKKCINIFSMSLHAISSQSGSAGYSVFWRQIRQDLGSTLYGPFVGDWKSF